MYLINILLVRVGDFYFPKSSPYYVFLTFPINNLFRQNKTGGVDKGEIG